MGCCAEFTPLAAPLAGTDPHSHVRFVKAMVLGVDDYVAEHAYLVGRTEFLTREAIGYGTTQGLAVQVEDDGPNGPRVRVGPGAAIVPSGKAVCVPSDQCGSLAAWLATEAAATALAADPARTHITAHLILCHIACPTHPVPMPGEPCRSDSALMEDSRVTDSFALRLVTTPPPHHEQAGIARLSAWLDAIVDAMASADPAAPPLPEADWPAAARAALLILSPADGSAPAQPPLPAGITAANFDDFLRLVWQMWLIEVRPRLAARHCHHPNPGFQDAPTQDDECVLLASLSIPVLHDGGADPATGWTVGGPAADVGVDQSSRPLIAPLHLVQSLLGLIAEGGAGGSGPGAPGERGERGEIGPEGPAGPIGPEGPAGPEGPQGPAGPEGPQGPPGTGGGAATPGPAGPQGPAGPAGADGAIGPAGPEGPIGPQGPAGPEGPIGPQGPAGPEGPRGETGAAGADGAPGPAGTDGAPGPAGAQGPAGPTGAAGPRGETGAQGPQGPQGAQGPQGVPGQPASPEYRHRLVIVVDGDPGNFTLTDAEDVLISIRREALAVNLPRAANAGPGRCYTFRSASRGSIRLRAANGEGITGRLPGQSDLTLDITSGQGLTFISDGRSNWFAISDLDQ